MASAIKLPNGSWRVQWVCRRNGRGTLPVGKVDAADAQFVKRRIEELLRLEHAGLEIPPGSELDRWLSRLPDVQYDRLVRFGMVEARGPGSKVPAPLAELSTLNWVGLPPGASLPGIYFLMFDGEVVYVGKGVVVGARAIAHMKSDKRYDGFYFINCAIEELDRLERRWIRELLPKHNRMTYEGE